MKTVVLFLILNFSCFAFADEAKVSVRGMVCGFCAQGITKKFKAEPSVEKIDVSLEKKIVTIDFKQGQTMADAQIETILKDSGYNVDKIERAK